MSNPMPHATTQRLYSLGIVIGLAIAYALLALSVLSFTLANGNVTLLWLPGGIGLAALLIGGIRLWPAIFIGATTAGLMMHDALWVSLLIAVGNSLESIFAARLLAKLKNFKSDLNKPRDFLLLALAAFICCWFSAIIGPLTLYSAGVLTKNALVHNCLSWWQADCLGIILGTPLVLIWQQKPANWLMADRLLETICLFFSTFLVGQIDFLDWLTETFKPLAMGYWLYLFVAWAALRYGRHGVTLIVAMVAIQAFIGAKLGKGFFAHDMANTGLENFWFYILILSTVGLFLATTLKARKLAEIRLRLADSLFHSTSEALLIANADNDIIAVNPAFTQITGYAAEEVLGKNPRILSSGKHNPEFYQNLWHQLDTQGHWQGEILNRNKNGEIFVEWMVINCIYDEHGKVVQRAALFSDITEKKKSEELIWQQANFDPLTQLPNRRLFGDRLQQEIRKTQRDQQLLGLLFLDLDRFKEVNDTLGHRVGDSLLIESAQRIKACVRKTDTVARLGGDEFTVIVTELNAIADLERITSNILITLSQPFKFNNDLVYISASIGIAIYPSDTLDGDELIRYADQAMYAAKNKGRNGFSYFTPEMQANVRKRLETSNDLYQALAKNEFQLYYQPIIDLNNGHILKAEALIRWFHPKRGLVYPVDFIHLAEENGLIKDIGDWVFQQAIDQVKIWRENYQADFQISINKSPLQFHKDNTLDKWLNALKLQQLSGQCLVIEITEGLLLDADDKIYEKLLQYSKAGIQVAIDDFGTGYSSLAYLKKFDIDYLKIDQSFVRNLAQDTNDKALSEAIVIMAHTLGLKVIAEGVETEQQLDLLKQIGCDYAQGYFFARPLSADLMTKLLANRHRQI